MAPQTRRRSARLASTQGGKASAAPQLSSLAEREESPAEEQTQSLNAVMSSPSEKPKTPTASTPVKLPMSERHPSKVHQTMTAAPSSGLKLGFVDINHDPAGREQPSGATQATPSKTPGPKPGFTFRVARPSGGDGDDNGLSSGAQKMMEELREEAARIKLELAAKKEKQSIEEQLEGRRIAKATGKAGRFSDVHMSEFKKMDSIANHPSALRAAPGRSLPPKTGLKRTQSKANLDEQEPVPKKTTSTKPTTKFSKQREEPGASTKRVRQRLEDDASTSRPVSKDGSSIPFPPPTKTGTDPARKGIPRSRTLTNLMTPTKASVARAQTAQSPTAALAKSPSKTDLSGLARSPSKPNLAGLARSPSKADFGSLTRSPSKNTLGGLTKSATTSNLNALRDIPSAVQTPGRFDRVRSILKRQFSTSKPRSSIPQLAGPAPKTPGKTERDFPSAPVTTPGRRFGFEKHVEFTPDTKQAALTQNSPSPVKSGIPRSKSYSKLPNANAPVTSTNRSGHISYPDLSVHRSGIEEGDGEESEQSDSEDTVDTVVAKTTAVPQSVPATFTFRSDHTISFGSSSPTGFGGSAGQASLRHVRASMTPVSRMPGGFPDAEDMATNKENADPAFKFGIPHGMSNKKRHRAIWDDEEVKSGIPHGMSNKKRHRAKWDEDEEQEDEGAQRAAKKSRTTSSGNSAPTASRHAYSSPMKKPARISVTPSPQKKSGLTLSRLNMLARPKNRR